MSDPKLNERGFAIYGEPFTDSRDQTIRLQESSEVGAAKLWIFVQGGHNDPPKLNMDSWYWPMPYLNVDQAKSLIAGLQQFVADAEDPKNWRNSEEYKAEWGDE